MKNTVWIVDESYDYEGSSLIGVFTSREKAIACLRQHRKTKATLPDEGSAHVYFSGGSTDAYEVELNDPLM